MSGVVYYAACNATGLHTYIEMLYMYMYIHHKNAICTSIMHCIYHIDLVYCPFTGLTLNISMMKLLQEELKFY